MGKDHLWTIIGDHINPGFQATKKLVDDRDIAGIQALAVRQVEAGADALDFTLGPDARTDPQFLEDAIRAVQDVVDVPLCFDYPEPETQEICLQTYDPGKARGAKPIINSIAETRWEMVELLKIQPCRVMIMASERLLDGVPASNQTGAEISETAKRAATRLMREHAVALDDVIVDVSIMAIIADTTGHNRAALEAIERIGSDVDLHGIHISGGIVNISRMLPSKAADGSALRGLVECAFLTLARPLGMDTVLGTPWRNFRLLPEDNYVFELVRASLDVSGTDALRVVRRLYAAK